MQKNKKWVLEFRVLVSDPEYPGIYRVVLVPYPTRIRSYSIRVLPVSVPNIKIPGFISEKTGICTIRIWYPTCFHPYWQLANSGRGPKGKFVESIFCKPCFRVTPKAG
jgi:hypothetical protein